MRVRKIVETTTSFVVCLSVFPSTWNSSAPTGRILMKFDIGVFFYNPLEKVEFHKNLTRITGTLYEHLCTFMISR